MIAFDSKIQDDFKHAYLIVWAETPEGRVRCRASYRFVEDMICAESTEEMKERMGEALEQLKPMFRHKIRAGEFAKCDIRTVTVA
jgi:hypothetical protein